MGVALTGTIGADSSLASGGREIDCVVHIYLED